MGLDSGADDYLVKPFSTEGAIGPACAHSCVAGPRHAGLSAHWFKAMFRWIW